MLRTSLILFFLGAVLGTLADFSHVASHTLDYPSPLLPLPGGQPIWVPILFASAALGIGLTHPWVDKWKYFKKYRPPVRSRNQVLMGVISFLLFYLTSGFLPFKTGESLDFILFGEAFAIWFFLDRTRVGLFLAGCTAIGGTCVELLLTHLGTFFYFPHTSNMMGVSSWLPWLYASASVSIGHLGRYLMAQSRPKRR